MSIEDAIYRLAAVTEKNAAVLEIIRQRDEALSKVARLERDLKWRTESRDSYSASAQQLTRRVTALKGAITRMKRNRNPSASPAPAIDRG